MTRREEVNNQYFAWLYDIACKNKPKHITYKKLFVYLHNTDFVWLIPNDQNRAEDGLNLRYRFSYFNPEYEDAHLYLRGQCSILEMMIALAIRCEEDNMDDPLIGDRTAQWFWGMIVNLGLGSMHDDRFDSDFVEEVLHRLNYREYGRDGKGGLFTVPNCARDLRTVEIWIQLSWYLSRIT